MLEKEQELMVLQVLVAQKRAHITTLKSLLGVAENRMPADMVRVEYKGMKLADIIATVLAKSSSPLTPKDVTALIYDTNSPEEFDRARSSVSTEMRSGAKGQAPKWQKIGRSAYAPLPSGLSALI
jgi:hypothetical protein